MKDLLHDCQTELEAYSRLLGRRPEASHLHVLSRIVAAITSSSLISPLLKMLSSSSAAIMALASPEGAAAIRSLIR